MKNFYKAMDKYRREIDAKEAYKYCLKCGKEITDYEDTKFNPEEGNLKFTYKCTCGFYGEEVFTVEYSHTEEIK